MQVGFHESQIVVQPHPSYQRRIIWRDQQRHRLRKPLEEHLVRGVNRQQTHPGDVLLSAASRKARILQAVPQDFMQGKLTGSYSSEARMTEVESKTHILACTIQPERPIGVDGHGLDSKPKLGTRARRATNQRFEFVSSASDRVGHLFGFQPSLERLKLRVGGVMPADTQLGQVRASQASAGFDIGRGPAFCGTALGPTQILVKWLSLAQQCTEVCEVSVQALRQDWGMGRLFAQFGQLVVYLQSILSRRHLMLGRVAVEIDNGRGTTAQLVGVPRTQHLFDLVTQDHGRHPIAA